MNINNAELNILRRKINKHIKTPIENFPKVAINNSDKNAIITEREYKMIIERKINDSRNKSEDQIKIKIRDEYKI